VPLTPTVNRTVSPWRTAESRGAEAIATGVHTLNIAVLLVMLPQVPVTTHR
jgi:hypothetical protein